MEKEGGGNFLSLEPLYLAWEICIGSGGFDIMVGIVGSLNEC